MWTLTVHNVDQKYCKVTCAQVRNDIEKFVIEIPYALNRIMEPSDGQTPSLYLVSRIIEHDMQIIMK